MVVRQCRQVPLFKSKVSGYNVNTFSRNYCCVECKVSDYNVIHFLVANYCGVECVWKILHICSYLYLLQK